jgi:sugar phosphate isomerase/epimerase
MLLDVGHLHITTDASHADIAAVAAAVAPDVVLFHVHDNLGMRRHDLDAPGIDPLKLDLHLPPGRGCLPWGRLAGVLRDHAAPLLLEVELSQRPSLPDLTAATLRVLAAEPQRAAA